MLRVAARRLPCWALSSAAKFPTRSVVNMATPTAGKAVAFHPAQRLEEFLAPTVWHEFTPLAIECKAVNLGQGFPGWDAPEFVRDFMTQAVNSKQNQYCRSAGHLSLCESIAHRYSTFLNRKIDPLTEVQISSGATQALFEITQALLNPGDEVVTFAPAFDLYLAQTVMAGGKVVPVPLVAKRDAKDGKQHWTFSIKDFEAAFTAKTRMVILNTPHNPTGKVFSHDELEAIAAVVRKYPDVVVVADEVYEFITFDGHQHQRIATLPGMYERTVTISSAGKTFSITGWKIGWTVGPAHLIRPVGIAHSWVQFSVSTPSQVAVALALDFADKPYQGYASYYAWLDQDYQRKRTLLADALRQSGLEPIMPEGSFFIMADTSNIRIPDQFTSDKSVSRDWAFCRFLTREIGVAAIPTSAFHRPEHKHLADNVARFAFCKTDEELKEAAVRLQKLKAYVK